MLGGVLQGQQPLIFQAACLSRPGSGGDIRLALTGQRLRIGKQHAAGFGGGQQAIGKAGAERG
ncbi:hypothetical protein D3C86_2104860 [compost metagenome]